MATRHKGLGAAAIGSVPEVEFLDNRGSSSNFSTYSFTSVPLGEESPTRQIVAVFGMRRGNTTFPSCSCTINGVSATQLLSRRGTASFADGSYMFIANVPTGTSGTIRFSLSLSGLCGLMGAWRVDNIESATPRDTATTAQDEPANMNVDVLENDVIIGMEGDYGRSATCSWTGVTEDYDFNVVDSTNRHQSGGSFIATADETNRLIQGNRSVVQTTTQTSLCAVFR